MESNSSLKSFSCNIHKNELIQRVSKELNTSQILYCIECLLDCEKSQRSTLIDINTVAEFLAKGFASIKPVKIMTSPPQTLSEVAEKTEDLLYKMIQHISGQKELVCAEMKRIQDEIIEKLEKSKEKILNDLDGQLAYYKKNLEDFSTKLSKSFQSENTDDTDDSLKKEDLIIEMNSCRSNLDLEAKLKSWMINIQEGKSDGNDDDKELRLIEILKAHRETLTQAIESPPISFVTNGELARVEKTKFDNAFENYLENLESFKNRITVFRFCDFKSEILSPEDFDFILPKIKENSKFRVKLIEKTSNRTPGFSLNHIENLWFKFPHLLMVVKKGNEKYAVYKDANYKKQNQQPSIGGGTIFHQLAQGMNCSTITFNLAKKNYMKVFSQTINYARNNMTMTLAMNCSLTVNDIQMNNEMIIAMNPFNSGTIGIFLLEFEILQLDFEGKMEYPVDENFSF